MFIGGSVELPIRFFYGRLLWPVVLGGGGQLCAYLLAESANIQCDGDQTFRKFRKLQIWMKVEGTVGDQLRFNMWRPSWIVRVPLYWSESEFFLWSLAVQCKHAFGLSMNPFGSDVAFTVIWMTPYWFLPATIHLVGDNTEIGVWRIFWDVPLTIGGR